MKSLIQHVKKHGSLLFWIVLGVSLVIRIWYVLQPTVVWWDAAIYISMGKYLFSGGVIGFWEAFRPPVLPIILGATWKIGLNPLLWGKVLQVIASLLTIFVTYTLGERLKKNTGLFAAVLLSFTPVFFAFTNVPLSDIPSTLFTLLAVYAVLKNKYFLSGLCAAIAFGLRFPQILIIAPLLLTILFFHTSDEDNSKKTSILSQENLKAIFKKSLVLLSGFFILALPYFILNSIYYHDPLYPIKVGSIVVANSGVHLYGDYLFYIYQIFIENPFIIFALIFLFVFFRNFTSQTTGSKKISFLLVTAFLIIAGYFSYNSHKEIRYSIGFLPYLMIMSGYGITVLIEKIKFTASKIQVRAVNLVTVSIIGVSLLGICFYAFHAYWPKFALTPAQDHYYTYFSDKGTVRVITSTPQMAVFSDIFISQVIDTFDEATDRYEAIKNNIDYIAFDNCNMSCLNESTCKASQDSYISTVQSENTLVFKEQAGWCQYEIYKRP